MKTVIKSSLIFLGMAVVSQTGFANDYLSITKDGTGYLWLITSEDGLYKATSPNLLPSQLTWSRVNYFGNDPVSNFFSCPYNFEDKSADLLMAYDDDKGLGASKDEGKNWQLINNANAFSHFKDLKFSCTQITHFADHDIINIVAVGKTEGSGYDYLRGMVQFGQGVRAKDGGVYGYNMNVNRAVQYDGLTYVNTPPEPGKNHKADGDNANGYFVALGDSSKIYFSDTKDANKWGIMPLLKPYQYVATPSVYPYSEANRFILAGNDNNGVSLHLITNDENGATTRLGNGKSTVTGLSCSETDCFITYNAENSNETNYIFVEVTADGKFGSSKSNNFTAANLDMKVENIVFLEGNYFIFTDKGIFIFDSKRKQFNSTAKPIVLPSNWQPEPIN